MRRSNYRMSIEDLERQYEYQQQNRDLLDVPDLLIQPVSTDIATLSQLGVQPSELPYTGDLLVDSNISFDEVIRRNIILKNQVNDFNQRVEIYKEQLKTELEEQTKNQNQNQNEPS